MGRLVGLVVSIMAARLLSRRARAGGVPLLLRGAPAIGRAELDRLPVAVGGAVRTLGGRCRTASASRSRCRRGHCGRSARSRSACGGSATARAGARRRREPPRRRAARTAARLDRAPARARSARPELGRRRGRPGCPRERLGGRRAVPLPPLSRAALLREQLEALAGRIKALLADGIEVFAYFQHEDAPDAPRVRRKAARLPTPDCGYTSGCYLERVRRCPAPLLPFVINR